MSLAGAPSLKSASDPGVRGTWCGCLGRGAPCTHMAEGCGSSGASGLFFFFCPSVPPGPGSPTSGLPSSSLLSWGIPLTITVAAVTLNKIGYDASDVSVGWCWVDLEAEDRLLWLLLTGKLWELLAYVTLPVLYLLVRRHINRAVGAGAGPPLPPADTQSTSGGVQHAAGEGWVPRRPQCRGLQLPSALGNAWLCWQKIGVWGKD